MSDLSLTSTIDPPAVSTAEVQGNFEDIRDFINSAAWCDDAKLASPTGAAYRTVLTATSGIWSAAAAGTYGLGAHESSAAAPDASPIDLLTTGTGRFVPLPGVYLAAADYVVAGKSTKLRVRGQVWANGTVPAINFTFGLYPVTIAGGANDLIATLGTVITGSTALVSSPAASFSTRTDSSDFAVPTDGLYALGVVTSAALTASNASLLTAQLQMRHV